MVKIVTFLVPIIPEHQKKVISLMFETETFGLCLVRKLRGGGHGPLGHPSGYAPALSSYPCTQQFQQKPPSSFRTSAKSVCGLSGYRSKENLRQSGSKV